MAATVVRMIDTIGQGLERIVGFSYWQERPVLSYTTRSFAASHAERAKFKHFFGIDQAPNDGLFDGAVVKDIETGGALNSNGRALARAGAHFVAYTFRANYSAMRAAIGHAPNVHYWIADWTASESRAIALLNSDPAIVAVQWASPSFGGGLAVPGTSSTLKGLNVDLSVGRADFWLPKAPAPKPHPAEGLWRGEYVHDVHNGHWKIQGVKGDNVVKSTAEVTSYAVVGVDLHTGKNRVKGIDRDVGKRLLGS